MKTKLLFLVPIIGIIFSAVFIFFQQSHNESEQAVLQFNQTVVTAIEDHFDSIIANPVCQYSESNPPAEGSTPECNWLMKWTTNGTEHMFNTARSENINYDSTYPLRPEYIQQELNQYFQSLSFKINSENTRVESLGSAGEQKNYIYAYENDTLRCSLTIPELLANGRSSYAPPYVVVGCSKI